LMLTVVTIVMRSPAAGQPPRPGCHGSPVRAVSRVGRRRGHATRTAALAIR